MRGKFIELTPKTMQLSLFLSDSIKLLAKRYISVKSFCFLSRQRFFRRTKCPFLKVRFFPSNRNFCFDITYWIIFMKKMSISQSWIFSLVKSEKRIFFFCVCKYYLLILFPESFWGLGPNFLFSKILFFASVDRVVSNLYQGEEHVWVGFWCGQRQGETGKRCW